MLNKLARHRFSPSPWLQSLSFSHPTRSSDTFWAQAVAPSWLPVLPVSLTSLPVGTCAPTLFFLHSVASLPWLLILEAV